MFFICPHTEQNTLVGWLREEPQSALVVDDSTKVAVEHRDTRVVTRVIDNPDLCFPDFAYLSLSLNIICFLLSLMV